MNTEIDNNQGEKLTAPDAKKNDRAAVTVMVVLLFAIIAYAGYEYFWLSLKRNELVNRNAIDTATTSPKKEVSGDKIEAEPTAGKTDKSEKRVTEEQTKIEAKNSGPAMLKINGQGKTYSIELEIKSECQTTISGETVEAARKTATLHGLNLNGKNIPLEQPKVLVCTYPAGVKEAYIPDPLLVITKVENSASRVLFSLLGTENQGSGRETVWREDFIFDLTKQTITNAN